MTVEQNPPGGPVILSYGQLVLWSLALAFLGVFCAVPLRTQTILREKLRFPSGTATANVIRTLHAVPTHTQAPEQLHTVHVIPEEPGTCPLTMCVSGGPHLGVLGLVHGHSSHCNLTASTLHLAALNNDVARSGCAAECLQLYLGELFVHMAESGHAVNLASP